MNNAKTTLILDDNEYCRAIHSDIFIAYGYKVETYPDPVTFFHTYAENQSNTTPRFDLILTDNQMPGMSGIEFLEKLVKENHPLKDVPKGIMSGDWAPDDLKKARALGCQIFSKPNMTELFDWVEAHSPIEELRAHSG